MSGNLYRRVLSWSKNNKNRSLAILVTICMAAAGAALLIIDGRKSALALETGLGRNAYGQGTKVEALEVDIEGSKERQTLEVEIAEQQYSSAEMKKLFQQSIRHMERWILGENKSLDRIEENMDLIKKVPGQPIDVEWELDGYDVMNVYGELQENALSPEGTLVHLSAVLTYSENVKEQAVYQCTAMVYPRTLKGGKKLAAELKDLIKTKEEESRTKDTLTLPSSIGNKQVAYYQSLNYRGAVLLIMAVLIAGLLAALDRQNHTKAELAKKRQMMHDYPEIINKFTLLTGAGMNVKSVWRKMVTDYEEQKAELGTRHAYEEMRITWNEMQGGITEAESYERFGRRCGLQAYLKFGALLSQNLRKGTRGLGQLLRADAVQTFEERKARAKRMGEEAGTKLLLPMFLMLSVVLVIVVVPAFLSIQI